MYKLDNNKDEMCSLHIKTKTPKNQRKIKVEKSYHTIVSNLFEMESSMHVCTEQALWMCVGCLCKHLVANSNNLYPHTWTHLCTCELHVCICSIGLTQRKQESKKRAREAKTFLFLWLTHTSTGSVDKHHALTWRTNEFMLCSYHFNWSAVIKKQIFSCNCSNSWIGWFDFDFPHSSH